MEYRDIKIAFKVKDPNSNSIIITNKAQISDDTDKDGKDITDKDSTPDEWNEGEDDQDVEHVKVEYFDCGHGIHSEKPKEFIKAITSKS